MVITRHNTGGISIADAAVVLRPNQPTDVIITRHCTGGIGIGDAAVVLRPNQPTDVILPCDRTANHANIGNCSVLDGTKQADNVGAWPVDEQLRNRMAMAVEIAGEISGAITYRNKTGICVPRRRRTGIDIFSQRIMASQIAVHVLKLVHIMDKRVGLAINR